MAARNASTKKTEEKIEELAMPMFLGEIVLAKANVIRYDSMSNRSCGAVGTLFITNFKVGFTCSGNTESHELKKVSSFAGLEKLLCVDQTDYDLIPLTVIHQVYAVSTSKQKRKKVKHVHKKEISSHYDIIEIETKDFRVIQYDFKFARQQERRSCFQIIMHHMYPTFVTNLFAFDYGKNVWKSANDSSGRAFSSFRNKKDYEMNLSRLRCSENWRVSSINSNFVLCKSLPELIVCPASLDDKSIEKIASSYEENRLPVWLWSDPNSGVSLLLSAGLSDEKKTEGHPTELLNNISSCQTKEGSSKTTSCDVSTSCPSLKELKHSLNVLRKSCVVRSIKAFWSTDTTWLSSIEDSGWIQRIATCLDLALRVVKLMKDAHTSVIIQDADGRNFSILISSLVQVLLDPYYRTHLGLQALIQKDWVTKGFPFSKRLGNLYQPQNENGKEQAFDGESPLFLLFLDCVHQLLRQYPQKFEFNEQFLILLIDCSYSSLFETFLFDSEAECKTLTEKAQLVTTWDFISTNIPTLKFNTVLNNPAYKLEESDNVLLDDQESLSSVNSSEGQAGIDVLLPSTSLSDLHMWNGFFFRWFPRTDRHKGSSVEVMLQLQQKQFMEEVHYLQDRLLQLQHMTSSASPKGGHFRTASVLSTDSITSNRTNTLTRRKKHTRNTSKFTHNEEFRDDFLQLMSGFYFLKML